MTSKDDTTPSTASNRRRHKQPNPTPEQKAARQQDAQARAATNERKKRTRNLIEMGGVCAAFGFSRPEQVERVMEALTRSTKGPDRLRALEVRETDRWPSD